jgi:hypothetical protein
MAFDLRMRALHCAQQSGNSASNPEQAFNSSPPILWTASGAVPPPQIKMEMKPMKKIILSAALAAMLASPTFAQSYNAGYGGGNIINLPALEHGGPTASGSEAFAYVPPRASARHTRNARAGEALSPNDPYTVYDESGGYAGRDPDPNVRFELHRDNAHDE